ncbi:MAG: hypothetical protein JWM35_330 [Verrucomicrobia bacterium]|nr:hypothetical protein [Verrucomicrobiota bacterium]
MRREGSVRLLTRMGVKDNSDPSPSLGMTALLMGSLFKPPKRSALGLRLWMTKEVLRPNLPSRRAGQGPRRTILKTTFETTSQSGFV